MNPLDSPITDAAARAHLIARLIAAHNPPEAPLDPNAVYGCFYCETRYYGAVYITPGPLASFLVKNDSPPRIRLYNCHGGQLTPAEDSRPLADPLRFRMTKHIECPYCGIDSVCGPACDEPLTPEFLHLMHRYWFGHWSPDDDATDATAG